MHASLNQSSLVETKKKKKSSSSRALVAHALRSSLQHVAVSIQSSLLPVIKGIIVSPLVSQNVPPGLQWRQVHSLRAYQLTRIGSLQVPS